MNYKYLIHYEYYNDKDTRQSRTVWCISEDNVITAYNKLISRLGKKGGPIEQPIIYDKANRIVDIKDIENSVNNKKEEDATQCSMVDGGRIDVFGSDANNKFDPQDWYKQLFELNDYNN